MTRSVHLVVPDLFLPREAFDGEGAPRAPALEILLARAEAAPLACVSPETWVSLETWLCAAFGAGSGAVAPVTLRADGGDPGAAYWLRADPVHLILRGSELVVHPVASLRADEAAQFCDSLNRHFDGDLRFVAQQPQRWYLRLADAPGITTHPLAQVAGKDMCGYLPQGPNALHWHRLLNEMQMLLYQHPANAEREVRGEWVVNSVWLWGGGRATENLLRPFADVRTDSALVAAFAQAAGIGLSPLPGGDERWIGGAGTSLVAWDGLRQAQHHGDFGAWRDSLQKLERHCIHPLLAALRRGRIASLTLDALQEHGSLRFTLTRGRAWQFWRGSRRLHDA